MTGPDAHAHSLKFLEIACSLDSNDVEGWTNLLQEAGDSMSLHNHTNGHWFGGYASLNGSWIVHCTYWVYPIRIDCGEEVSKRLE